MDVINQRCREKALVSHAARKAKFRKFMSGQLSLEAAEVERSNACDFGKWLETREGAALGPLLGEIRTSHAAFHKAAAGVVRDKLGGRIDQAEASLGPLGTFGKATTGLSSLIIKARDSHG